MPVKQRGQRFQATVHHQGERWRESFTSARMAKAWELEAKAELLRGRKPRRAEAAPAAPECSLSDLLDLTVAAVWRNTRSEDKHVRIAEGILRLLGPRTQLRTLTTAIISTKVIDRWHARGLKASTINRRRAVFMKMQAVAVQRGVITEAVQWPKEAMKMDADGTMEGQAQRWLTRGESEKLLHELTRINSTTARFCAVLLDTGMRLSELLKLHWQSIRFDAGQLVVTHSKSGRPRTVPMTQRCTEVLKLQLQRQQINHAVLQGPFSDWSQHIVARHFNEARLKAGLGSDVTRHTLRHTFATNMARGGMQLHVLQRLLGHANITTTMVYAHHAPQDMEQAVKILEGS